MADDDRTERGAPAEGGEYAGDLDVGFGVVIPARELVEQFSRSGGPGGQRTNKVATRVSLAWDVAASRALDDAQRARLRTRLGARLTGRGELVVHAQSSREQARNRAEARTRMAALVRDALAPPDRPRRATKPTRGSVKRRLADKRRRSETKRGRGTRVGDDD